MTFSVYPEQIHILDTPFMSLYEKCKWEKIEANKGGFLRITVSNNALEADLAEKHTWLLTCLGAAFYDKYYCAD